MALQASLGLRRCTSLFTAPIRTIVRLFSGPAPAPSKAAAPSIGQARKARVGIVGYGALGRYLTKAILQHPDCQGRLELAFVCKPTDPSAPYSDPHIPAAAVLESLKDFASTKPDLIVEVAHQSISKDFGVDFLRHCDYMPASITAFADAAVESSLRHAASSAGRSLYIPAGALWGAKDIQKMADRGSLGKLTVTMAKAPHHFKLTPGSDVAKALEAAQAQHEKVTREGLSQQAAVVLYEGPVRGLCAQAPSNVNTMAAAALAGHTLGMDGTTARLVADFGASAHVVTVDAEGKRSQATAKQAAAGDSKPFRIVTTRFNPAEVGAVTGDATYASFLSSMLEAAAGSRGGGMHFC